MFLSKWVISYIFLIYDKSWGSNHRYPSVAAAVAEYRQKLLSYGPRRNAGMWHDVILQYEARQVLWFFAFCVSGFFIFFFLFISVICRDNCHFMLKKHRQFVTENTRGSRMCYCILLQYISTLLLFRDLTKRFFWLKGINRSL